MTQQTIRERALDLRKKGLTYKEISSALDGAVSVDWCKRNLKDVSTARDSQTIIKNIVDALVNKASSDVGCSHKEARSIAAGIIGYYPTKDKLRYYKDLARKQGVEFGQEFIPEPLDVKYSPKDYYVYAVELDSRFVYIGKGYKERWKHCISGTSHVYELNKHHFCGTSLRIVCLADQLDSRQAHWFEQGCLNRYSPEFNIRGSGKIFHTEVYEVLEEYKVVYDGKS